MDGTSQYVDRIDRGLIVRRAEWFVQSVEDGGDQKRTVITNRFESRLFAVRQGEVRAIICQALVLAILLVLRRRIIMHDAQDLP